ncbi:MAG: hypothetical protein P8Q26_16465, partial [Ascidiaceihabitans sp.]|nr:hypothetical protein [Ascidiaceihabitans sp.]
TIGADHFKGGGSGRLSDKQVQEILIQLDAVYAASHLTATFGSHITLKGEKVRTTDLGSRSHLVQGATYNCSSPNIQITFARGISRSNFEAREPSNYYDEIKITANSQNSMGSVNDANHEDLLEIYNVIRDLTTSIEPTSIASTEAGNTAILNAEVSKLAALATELIEGADEKRRELDSLRETLNADLLQKEAELSAKLETENQKLEDKKIEIQTQQDEFDDREHKHVRRKLRSEIIEEVANILERPTGRSYRNFWPLFGIVLSLIGVASLAVLVVQNQAVIAGLYSDGRPTPSATEIILAYAKMTLTSAAALGLLLYAVTWMRSLANQSREYEKQLHRYSLDMTRASWTMETLMELSKDDKQMISDLWLESVTKNLFEADGGNRDETNSLQALGALLNVTSETEIGPDGTKFRLNRRAAKKAASQAEG